jgi:hypothetical protein
MFHFWVLMVFLVTAEVAMHPLCPFPLLNELPLFSVIAGSSLFQLHCGPGLIWSCLGPVGASFPYGPSGRNCPWCPCTPPPLFQESLLQFGRTCHQRTLSVKNVCEDNLLCKVASRLQPWCGDLRVCAAAKYTISVNCSVNVVVGDVFRPQCVVWSGGCRVSSLWLPA